MCLTNPYINDRIKNGKVQRVYKIAIKYPLQGKCTSAFGCHMWNVGENASSREDTKLTEYEKEAQEVNQGFHVFVKKEDAVKCLKDFTELVNIEYLTIITCLAYPQNYVCSGFWDDAYDVCTVYTKLTIEKREMERALKRTYTEEGELVK